MTFRDYLEEHFNVKEVSGGSQLHVFGECPFCGGIDAMYVSASKDTGICFKCKGFSGVRFVMAHAKCSYIKAKALLHGDEKGDAFLHEEEKGGGESPVWFPRVSSPPERAIRYLLGRGVSREMIGRFGVCFCDTNTRVEDKIYPTKERVIFPIYDMKKEIIAWQGRDITGKSPLRYFFPTGFEGANYLYNACNILRNESYLIITEGVFDVFGWYRAGFKNVVATFGKKISDEQMDVIRDLNPKSLYMAWDCDANWLKNEFAEKYSYLFSIRLVDLGLRDSDELLGGELRDAFSKAKKYDWAGKILSALACL